MPLRSWHLLAASLTLHTLAWALLKQAAPRHEARQFEDSHITIVHKPKPVEAPPEPQDLPPKNHEDKPKPLSKNKLQKKLHAKPKPVLGLPPPSLSPEATGIAVPMGNTLMDKDRGIKLEAKDIVPLSEDLSRAASIIETSITKPKYTDEALDAGLAGNFTVNVFVDELGNVTKANLENKIGFNMDDRVLKTAQQAKFKPRMNSIGQPVAGWSKIVFGLRIE